MRDRGRARCCLSQGSQHPTAGSGYDLRACVWGVVVKAPPAARAIADSQAAGRAQARTRSETSAASQAR